MLPPSKVSASNVIQNSFWNYIFSNENEKKNINIHESISIYGNLIISLNKTHILKFKRIL